MTSQYEINRKAAKDFIESQGWDYDTAGDKDGRAIYSLEFDVNSILGSITVFVLVSDTDIQSVGMAHVTIDEEALPRVAEYLTRANYGLKIGNFELDYDGGYVRYQSILSCVDASPSQSDVGRVIWCPPVMFERYGDGLAKVDLGFQDPASAVETARGQ